MQASISNDGAAAAAAWLAGHAQQHWRDWNADPLAAACEGVAPEDLADWPDVAHWRARACFMRENAEALACLELAHRGHAAAGDRAGCARDVNLALVLCLIDVGAMDQVERWLGRRRAADASASPADAAWQHLGALAAAVLGDSQSPEAASAEAWLLAALSPLCRELSPDERLIAAQVLVNHWFAGQRYEQFDLAAAAVETPACFAAASPQMRARWLYTLGFAHYQIGNHERAERSWNEALAGASRHGLEASRMLVSLALLRLLIDRGRIAEAQAIEQAIQPRWGAGRASQLVVLQQMRARLLLLQQQPARAHATLAEALALAAQGGLPLPELASCRTDRVQVLIALQRTDEAEALLAALCREHHGRDGAVYSCLHDLLQAWRLRDDDPAASGRLLRSGLHAAQQLRYSMFFRLLPALAAEICALALRWQIEPVFVAETISARGLPAPAAADAHWPWPLWLQMLGDFQLRLHGQLQRGSGKAQQKPLELLRLLACERTLMLGAREAADLLWPEADAPAARKNLDMAVQRLRRLLGDATLVRVEEGRVGLDSTRASSDVVCRRRLIDRLEVLAVRAPDGQHGPSDETEAEGSGLIARLLALGFAALLPGVTTTPWLEAHRRQCQREVVRAARAAASVLRRAGAARGEIELLESALHIEPMSETLARRLIEAHVQNGRRSDARCVFQRFTAAADQHGGQPDARALGALQRLMEPVSPG